MATVVSIMDEPGWEARTDNIVVVEPDGARLTWVPRDLWSPIVGNRINIAFKRGGHELLRAALAEHDIRVDHGLCFSRPAVEAALRDVSVRVPVARSLRFWYPASPGVSVHVARKLIGFEPPAEVLSGERVHQWLGAWYAAGDESDGYDLGRIRRQQVFVRRLLEDGLDFALALADPAHVSLTGPGALDDLRQVRADWRFEVVDDLRVDTIDGLAVLVRPATDEAHT